MHYILATRHRRIAVKTKICFFAMVSMVLATTPAFFAMAAPGPVPGSALEQKAQPGVMDALKADPYSAVPLILTLPQLTDADQAQEKKVSDAAYKKAIA